MSQTQDTPTPSADADATGVAEKDLGAFASFDPLLPSRNALSLTQPWTPRGYECDQGLLHTLLQAAIGHGDGITQQSGRVAASLDIWIANELRRAGFPPDEVWPRDCEPRLLPSGLADHSARLNDLRDVLALTEGSGNWGSNLQLRKGKGSRLTPAKLRTAITKASEAGRLGGSMRDSRILGQFYYKQVDVLVSSWMHGPDVIVSTKTMFSSYDNNRNNRYEETLGEATNLRGRYPLAAMGYAFLLRSNVHDGGKSFHRIADLVARLRRPHGPYDATMLLVADWDEDGRVLRSVGGDPKAASLGPDRFFEDLVGAVISRSPFDASHGDARQRRERAAEPDPTSVEPATTAPRPRPAIRASAAQRRRRGGAR